MLWVPNNRNLIENAVAVAKKSDIVIMCMGLSPRLEGEEIKGLKIDGFLGGDRTDLVLPENQQKLIKIIAATGKPIVLVLLNGSAVAINWENEKVSAILEAWYPGQAAGDAIGKILFGKYNPSGRLPVTFYKSVKDLPNFEDYSMKNRTYRYFSGEPLYPFGYGLSYSDFAYSNMKMINQTKIGEKVNVSVDVTNTSNIDGEEVVQLYISNKTKGIDVELPKIALKGFQKIALKAGETKTVTFEIKPEHFAYTNNEGKLVLAAGDFDVSVGGILSGYKAETTGFLKQSISIK